MIIKSRTGCTVDSGHARMGSPRPPAFSIFGRQHPGARQVPRWDSKSTWSTTHTRSAAMPSSHGDQLVPTPQRRTRAAARYPGRWRAPSVPCHVDKPARPPRRQVHTQPGSWWCTCASQSVPRPRWPKPAGLQSRSAIGRSGSAHPRTGQKRYINDRADRLGGRPWAPVAQQVAGDALKRHSVWVRIPPGAPAGIQFQSLATMSVAAENIFSCTLQLLSISQRACPT
jgi:hypothetical protein